MRMYRIYLIVLFLLLLTSSCGGRRNAGVSSSVVPAETLSTGNLPQELSFDPSEAPLSATSLKLDSMGYVNVGRLDPSITVNIVYATKDNFMGEVLYEDLTEAYLLPDAAEKLVAAHEALKRKKPGYRFIVYDAARPMSVQRKIWRTAVRTGKQDYVANPAKGGGLHNYGAAVDISILDENGTPLPMGTDYDYMDVEANIDKENELLGSGKITAEELTNRLLLREIMTQSGFRTIRSEWWHFNLCSLKEAVEKYPLIDF